MSAHTQARDEILEWLQANLGEKSTASLTGTDIRALIAADAIMEHYALNRKASLIEAWRMNVLQMQVKCYPFAYHLIAKALDWEDRGEVWDWAGLDPLENIPVCKYSPEGRAQCPH